MGLSRVIAIDGLRDRLRSVLGGDSLLFRRFERALSRRDALGVAAALDTLALYPGELRQQVEDAILAWLLDGGEPLATPGLAGRKQP
jgi:hypothetical protein